MSMKNYVAAAALCLASGAAMADYVGGVIFGSGVADGNFTLNDEATQDYLAIGLRARTRFPTPSNAFSPLSGNTYTQATGGYTSAGAAGGPLASWNFDWSMATPGNVPFDHFTYRLTIDYDPGTGTGNNQAFDLIWDYATWGLPGGYFDHSFSSGSIPPAGADGWEASSNAGYLFELDGWANTRVQNSWNLGSFTDATHAFDPNAEGLYTISLDAFVNGQRVTGTTIQVNVVDADANTVPVPATWLLVLAGAAGLQIRRRHRRPAA